MGRRERGGDTSKMQCWQGKGGEHRFAVGLTEYQCMSKCLCTPCPPGSTRSIFAGTYSCGTCSLPSTPHTRHTPAVNWMQLLHQQWLENGGKTTAKGDSRGEGVREAQEGASPCPADFAFLKNAFGFLRRMVCIVDSLIRLCSGAGVLRQLTQAHSGPQ